MKRTLTVALGALLLAGCSTMKSVEYDAAAQAATNYWTGVFFLAVVIVGGIALSVGLICDAIKKRAEYRAIEAANRFNEARERAAEARYLAEKAQAEAARA